MNAGERAARERVEAVYAAVDRLTPDDLRLTTMPVRDKAVREGLVAGLERAAVRAGRGELLGEARAWLRQAIGARTLARYRPEAGVWGVSAGGLVQDRVEVLLALEDTVSVAATEDLLDPREAAALADPGRGLLGLAPLTTHGSEPEPPPAGTWEPSAADWAAAVDDGPAAVDVDEPMSGGRAIQRMFFWVAGGFGAVTLLALGAITAQPVVGILGACAAITLAWAFATYRPARRR